MWGPPKAWLSTFVLLAWAAMMVAQVGQPQTGEDLEALLKKLKSPFTNEVTDAARSLERQGTKAKVAVPDLNQALMRAAFSDERVAIVRALGAMGPAAEEAVPNLVLTLKRAGLPQEKQAILKALGRMGPAACSAVPALVEVMRTGLPEDARLAAEVLGEIGPSAREAVPVLRLQANSGFSNLKAAAAQALRKIQANDLRYGIRDNAQLFTREALQKANQELQGLAARQQLGILVETYSMVPAEQAAKAALQTRPDGLTVVELWAQERVRTADFNGLLVLICRNPLQAAVAPTPTARAAFGPQGCVKLRDQIIAHLTARQPDAVLSDLVGFMQGRSLRPATEPMP
jgi:hypothetical protein